MKYFTIEELVKSDTAKKKRIDNTPPPDVRANLVVLVERLLDPLRERYGHPIYVNSGYRCLALNQAVKGASTSQHMKGEAVDIDTRLGKKENMKLFSLIQREFDFDQLIDESDYSWVHVSFRLGNRQQTLHL